MTSKEIKFIRMMWKQNELILQLQKQILEQQITIMKLGGESNERNV